MQILIKYPTRQRPELFLKTLSNYIDKATDNSTIQYLISFDDDDATMTKDVIEKAMSFHENVVLYSGKGFNKIEACNRDIDKANPWDILLLVSDDMQAVADGWDQRIKEDMNKFYPDTDGCLWYHDGAQAWICTLSCIGRKYYETFGYVYHPSYKSFFCDNEFTDIARAAGKMQLISRMIIKHEHPSWQSGIESDVLYEKNNKYWAEDESNYANRKAKNFI